MSSDAKESGSDGTQKGSSLENRKEKASANLDLTTAMGGTIDEDLDHALLGESKESEEDLKETLTNKIVELEMKLRQTDDYYEKLTNEIAAAKDRYEKEREECEDVVSVAKRNIENQVAKILDLQRKKRELADKIQSEEERLMKEEEETRVELKSEEERLTRNIVVLQTKLLINEGVKFERDELLSRIQFLEKDLIEKENFYQEELQKAKEQIQEKYDRLLKIANSHKGSIAEQVKSLSQRQQIGALKHAQEEIVRTQSAYKKTTKRMLQLMGQNKVLRERNHDKEVQVAIQQSLMAAATTMAQELQEKKADLTKKKNKHSESFGRTIDDASSPLTKQIEELKLKLFRFQDEESELNEILEDQRRHLNAVKDRKQALHDIEQRLVPLADIAEHIVQKGKVILKQNFDDPTARYEIFQKLSAILMESDELQKYMRSDAANAEHRINKESTETLPPLKETSFRSTQRKAFRTNQSEHGYTKHLDTVEKTILSDLGLLGKYGSKQKYVKLYNIPGVTVPLDIQRGENKPRINAPIMLDAKCQKNK